MHFSFDCLSVLILSLFTEKKGLFHFTKLLKLSQIYPGGLKVLIQEFNNVALFSHDLVIKKLSQQEFIDLVLLFEYLHFLAALVNDHVQGIDESQVLLKFLFPHYFL